MKALKPTRDIFFLLTVIFISCNNPGSNYQNADVAWEEAGGGVSISLGADKEHFAPPEVDVAGKTPSMTPGNNVTAVETQVLYKKKIIKDGNIVLKTDDIGSAKSKIDITLKTLQGYYETEDLKNNDQRMEYDLKIRVRSENFEKLVAAMENGLGEVKGKSINARDVTEEYVDIETRLANKREYLKRYRELLVKAATVKDILLIEENIRTIQEEIESREGRLKYLADQVAFSTLNVNLHRDKEFVYTPPQRDKFGERMKRSLSGGWAGFVDFILRVIEAWPAVIIVAFLIWALRRFLRKRRSKQKE